MHAKPHHCVEGRTSARLRPALVNNAKAGLPLVRTLDISATFQVGVPCLSDPLLLGAAGTEQSISKHRALRVHPLAARPRGFRCSSQDAYF